jgi:hypothetical protein
LKKIFIFLALILFVVVTWALNLYFLYNNDERGTFGDMFGGLNTLFSGLAFAGLVYAIILQSEEIKLQKEELSETRKVLEEQKQEFIEQNKTNSLQRFENSFFNLIETYSKISANLIFDSRSGKQVFDIIYSKLGNRFTNNFSKEKEPKEHVKNFLNTNQIFLSHYFNFIKIIIEFLRKERMSIESKKNLYFDIFSSQFSEAELLYFYYWLNFYGEDKDLMTYLNSYGFFKNLNKEKLLSQEDLIQIYDKNN